jgi:hypothetical protein
VRRLYAAFHARVLLLGQPRVSLQHPKGETKSTAKVGQSASSPRRSIPRAVVRGRRSWVAQRQRGPDSSRRRCSAGLLAGTEPYAGPGSADRAVRACRRPFALHREASATPACFPAKTESHPAPLQSAFGQPPTLAAAVRPRATRIDFVRRPSRNEGSCRRRYRREHKKKPREDRQSADELSFALVPAAAACRAEAVSCRLIRVLRVSPGMRDSMSKR